MTTIYPEVKQASYLNLPEVNFDSTTAVAFVGLALIS
jgi:hypothetical protein